MSNLMSNHINNPAIPVAANPTPFTASIGVSEELERLGEKLGEFKAYDSQLPLAEIAGTRIVKCLYKENPKTGKKIAENSYVRIPTKHLSEEHIVSKVIELAPFVLSWLQEQEDKDIKSGHSKGLLSVHTSLMSMNLIIEKLEESMVSTRLTKEKVGQWFDAEMSEVLQVLIADKMQLGDDAGVAELEKLDIIVAAYKGKYESLAGGKTSISKNECKAMIDVIIKCEADNTLLGSKFIGKLEAMSKKDEEILFSL